MGLTVILSAALLFGCGSGEEAQQPTEETEDIEETTVIERTVFQTVMEEPEEEEEEDADAVMGERLALGGIQFQIFDRRSEQTIHYVSGPGSSFESKESSEGEYIAIDFMALNESGEEAAVLPEATLTDSGGEVYEVDESIEPPTDNSGGLTIGDSAFLSSTLFFDLPEDAGAEMLTLSFGGDEATVDLTNRDADELEPLNYLSIYTLWFNQRAYDDIYGLFESSSTQEISESEWVSYFEPLWGEWYLGLESVVFDDALSSETQSFSVMERTFYETSGALTSSPVDQELVKYGDEWRFVMRQDQVDDILGIAPAAPVAPEETHGMPEEEPEESIMEFTTPPVEQYDPTDLDPDPDPDPDRPRRPYVPDFDSPSSPTTDPDAGYPSDGWYPGAPDLDCEDFPGGVTVSPGDPYELDGDGDGTACE